MPEAIIETETAQSKIKTITVENKQIVMPKDTVTLKVEDVLYYEKNKNQFDDVKKSPYLIYLSTEFKKAVKKRNKLRIFKLLMAGALFGMGMFALATLVMLLRTKN